MKKLQHLVNELQRQINNASLQNQTVSSGSVGWHISHSLLTIEKIIESLALSKEEAYKWKFSLAKTIVYTIGKIPRGKGKAPKIVQPKAIISIPELEMQYADIMHKLSQLTTIKNGQYFFHPYFGNLKLKEAIRFLEIHTKHHVNIIYDIVKQ